MRALRDGARTQGDRKGSPLLETAWQADLPVYSRGWACPCPAALHSFFHSPAKSLMVARSFPLMDVDPFLYASPSSCLRPWMALRLQERPFQICLMVLLSVVVRHGPRLIPRAELADVGETAVDQREHVLRRLLVKEPPITPTGHVDRRGVCHHPAPPGIVMQDRVGIAGAAHTRGQPGMAVHLDPRLQLQAARARTILRRGDHAPLLDDLEGVDREDRLCPRLHLDHPAVSTQAYRVSDRVAVHAERDDGSAAHEGPSCRQVSAPRLVREVLVRRNVDIGTIEPYGYVAGHLVGAPDQR